MTTIVLLLVGVALAVGLIGIVLPVIPGLLLCWAAILGWAVVEQTAAAWLLFAGASVLFLVSQVLKFAIPGSWMRSAEVPWSTMAIGGILAIVGFFVIPVIGLVIGFVGGVYVGEWSRLHSPRAAWPSTVRAVKAVGLAILIELGAGLAITAAWLGVVLFGLV